MDDDKTADDMSVQKEKRDADASEKESSVGDVGVCEVAMLKQFTVEQLDDIASRAASLASAEGARVWKRGYADLAQAAHYLELMERRCETKLRLCEVYGCENHACMTVDSTLVEAREGAPRVIGNVPICKPCAEKYGFLYEKDRSTEASSTVQPE